MSNERWNQAMLLSRARDCAEMTLETLRELGYNQNHEYVTTTRDLLKEIKEKIVKLIEEEGL